MKIATTCPYCGVGCGVLAERAADGSVTVGGDPDHPANFSRLCSKGSALGETIDLDGRLLYPTIDGRRADREAALDLVARTFADTIAEHGPDSVAFYVSGQLLTEDYYVANKLMKGFIGSANIDTNSRLCMASAVAGHRRAFGSDTVPGTYEDLELADLVVLVGSNLAWCHPVLYQRLAAARQARPEMRVVLIDPRRTMTADVADLHLPIRADGDTALFTGLLSWLAGHDAIDRDYVEAHTTGLDAALAAAPDVATVAELTGLDPELLVRFYELFQHTDKVVTAFSQGVNQSSSGTDKVNAILNCHLATGRIGRPGAGPFSVTGQPNAMGGREVGGLANMLAAHMEIENPVHRDRVRRFWNAPAMAATPGLKAVDLFRAVADGRIKALWIMATNPVDSMPEADLVAAALEACPFVVVSDVVARTDTLRYAHVALPAAAWGEKDGTVTNSERRISRQRPFLPLPGEALPDWRIICEVAGRMGFGAAFAYRSPGEIFAEHAALSGFENDGARDFDIGGLETEDFDSLAPVQWPVSRSGQQRERFFADGGFYTPDRKARFVAVTPSRETRTTAAFPMVLNTGRVRDHWHTLTRTGKSPRLSQHFAEPFAEIHPADAAREGITDADLLRVTSAEGSIVVRALLTRRQARGAVFVPMHWTDQFASAARVDVLLPGRTDPVSGQPASKHGAVRIERFEAARYGFAVLRDFGGWSTPSPTLSGGRGRSEPSPACGGGSGGSAATAEPPPDYWALARCPDGWRLEFAFTDAATNWQAFATRLFGLDDAADLLGYWDATARHQRFAAFADGRMLGALFLAPQPVEVSRSWAVDQLTMPFDRPTARLAVIAGRPGRGADRGATVCSCFAVGRNQITTAIRSGCHTVAAVGEATQAGTNCGSCRSEIRGLLDLQLVEAAE